MGYYVERLLILLLAVIFLWAGLAFLRRLKASRKKAEDYSRLLAAMREAKEGSLESLAELGPDNEYQGIADVYNDMVRSLKGQMERNKQMADLVAMSQLKQLESQFKPHFLYNTLENIRYMYKIDPAAGEKMLLILSNLLRYSMEGSGDQVPLKKDVACLENYLLILKYRYGRRLAYTVEVSGEAGGCLVPRLIVQPLIENAVKYGFGNRENLCIELKAYCHEGKLTIICRDDGMGMSAGMLAEVTEVLRQEENTSGHFGLYSIHRRVQLLYGAVYGVEIRSREELGTAVVVNFPVRQE